MNIPGIGGPFRTPITFFGIIFAGVCYVALMTNGIAAPAFANPKTTHSYDSVDDIRNLVENYSNLENCIIENYHRFGFNGDLETELVVEYRIEDVCSFTDVFTLVDPENPIRLYHDEGHIEVIHCSYDDVGYLFTYTNEGSGCFLQGILFSWDGVGPLTAAYHQESLHMGGVKETQGHLYFADATKYFRLDKTTSGFELVEYFYDVTWPDLGWNVHVLKTVEVAPDSFSITLDNRELSFVQTQTKGIFGYGSRDTFRIGINEEILILGPGGKWSPEDLMQRGNSIVRSFVPKRKGHMGVSVEVSSHAYYVINFFVTNPFFLLDF